MFKSVAWRPCAFGTTRTVGSKRNRPRRAPLEASAIGPGAAKRNRPGAHHWKPAQSGQARTIGSQRNRARRAALEASALLEARRAIRSKRNRPGAHRWSKRGQARTIGSQRNRAGRAPLEASALLEAGFGAANARRRAVAAHRCLSRADSARARKSAVCARRREREPEDANRSCEKKRRLERTRRAVSRVAKRGCESAASKDAADVTGRRDARRCAFRRTQS